MQNSTPPPPTPTTFAFDVKETKHLLSESQYHRMDDVGSGLCRLSSPLPCSKQHQLQQVSQGHVQSGFEYLYGWRLHNSKQPVPMFSHPHSKKINKFMFKCNFPYFSLCPQLPVLSLGTNKSLALSSFYPCPQSGIYIH